MNCPILPPLSLIQSGCLIDCAIEDVPNRTGTCTHAHKKQGLVRLLTGLKLDFWYWSVRLGPVSNSYWALPFFFFLFFWSVFSLQIGALCLLGVHYYFWLLFLLLLFMIIICHYCLLKIGTSRFVCPLMPLLKEINYCYEYYSKRFLDSEVFPPSSSSTFLIPHFPSPYSLSSVCSSLAWTLVLFCLFRCLVAGATLLDLDFIPGNLLEWASLFTCSDKLILHRISPVMMLKITNIV